MGINEIARPKDKRGRKFETWDIRVDGQLFKIEVRAVTDHTTWGNSKTSFECVLPGSGTRMYDENVNALRKAVDAQLKAEHELKWEKILAVSGGSKDTFGTLNYVTPEPNESFKHCDNAIALEWRTYFRAKTADGWCYREDEYHHVSGCTPLHGNNVQILEWTQEREDILRRLSVEIVRMGNRMRKFFSDDNVGTLLDSVGITKLLGANKDE
jgi:hypothetical protein